MGISAKWTPTASSTIRTRVANPISRDGKRYTNVCTVDIWLYPCNGALIRWIVSQKDFDQNRVA